MKTPLQEILKLESDLTHMFDSDQRVAMALLEHIRNNRKSMLEKEKEVAHQYAEFAIKCDRKELPVLEFDGWINL